MTLLISSIKNLLAQWSMSARSQHKVTGSIPLSAHFAFYLYFVFLYKKRTLDSHTYRTFFGVLFGSLSSGALYPGLSLSRSLGWRGFRVLFGALSPSLSLSLSSLSFGRLSLSLQRPVLPPGSIGRGKLFGEFYVC